MWLYIVISLIMTGHSLAQLGCTSDQIPQPVMVLGEPYLMKSVFQQVNEPPELILYDEGDIFFHKNNRSYVLRKESSHLNELRYNAMLKSKKIYVDHSGKAIVNLDGKVTLIQNKKDIQVLMEKDFNTVHMTVDFEKSRVFLLAYPNDGDNVGTLFAFDTNSLDIVGGKMYIKEIDGLGYNITAVSVDKSTGNLALCVSSENNWWFKIIEKVDSTPCKCSNEGINKKALEAAVLLGGREIIRLYTEAMTGNYNSYNEYNLVFASPGIQARSAETKEIPVEVEDEPFRLAYNFKNNTALESKIIALKEQIEKLNNNIYSAAVSRDIVKLRSRSTIKTVSPLHAAREKGFVCAPSIEMDRQAAAIEEALLQVRSFSALFHSMKDSIGVLSKISTDMSDNV